MGQSESLPEMHLSLLFFSLLHLIHAWWLSQGSMSVTDTKHFLCFLAMITNTLKHQCALDGGQKKNDNLHRIYNLQQVPVGVYVCTFNKKMVRHILCVLDRMVGHKSICWDYVSTLLCNKGATVAEW